MTVSTPPCVCGGRPFSGDTVAMQSYAMPVQDATPMLRVRSTYAPGTEHLCSGLRGQWYTAVVRRGREEHKSLIPREATMTDPRVEIVDKTVCYDGFFRMERYRLRHRLFSGAWSRVLTR